MALGGGTFINTNKILPGSYINFVSAKRTSSSLTERGIAAIALELDWLKVKFLKLQMKNSKGTH